MKLLSWIAFVMPAQALCAWSGVLMHLWLNDELSRFLHPSFHPLVLMTSIVIGVIGLAYVFCMDPLHSLSGKEWRALLIRWGALSLPLLVLFNLPSDDEMTEFFMMRDESSAAMAIGASAYREKELREMVEGPARTHEVDLLDLYAILVREDWRSRFEDREIVVIGMGKKDQAPGGFSLGRLVMTCCVADARPIRAEVRGASAPEKRSWMKVKGRVKFEDDLVVIEASEAQEVEAPEELFLF